LPVIINCPHCGKHVAVTTEGGTCPNCGAYVPPRRVLPPEVYSGSVVASGLVKEASATLGGTISILQHVPREVQERMGITDIVPQFGEVKADVEALEFRVKQLEETLAERDEFVKLKREREVLYLPNGVLARLPPEVTNIIVNTIQKCFERGIPQACPPFMRKALVAAITIRFKMDNKEAKLYDANREPFGLPKMIELAKQEGYLSSYLAGQLMQIKIFGDIAVHDFKVDLKEQDVIPDFRLLRLALEHMYR